MASLPDLSSKCCNMPWPSQWLAPARQNVVCKKHVRCPIGTLNTYSSTNQNRALQQHPIAQARHATRHSKRQAASDTNYNHA